MDPIMHLNWMLEGQTEMMRAVDEATVRDFYSNQASPDPNPLTTLVSC